MTAPVIITVAITGALPRKKDNPANMKQYCTSNPESADVPRVFRRENNEELQEGDLSFLS